MLAGKKRTFVSDGEVVGFVPASTWWIGYHTNLYAVAKRRINKWLPVFATGAYCIAWSRRSLLFYHGVHLH